MGDQSAPDMSEVSTPVFVANLVATMVIPPVVLVGVVYGLSLVVGTSFTNLVFVVTLVSILLWWLVTSTAFQKAGGSGREGHDFAVFMMASDSYDHDPPVGGSHVNSTIARVFSMLSPGYVALLLTLTAVLGWIVVGAQTL